jgi:AraC-like DNA-binding protein/TolB-like protein
MDPDQQQKSFLQDLKSRVLQNLTNEQFGVEDFAREMGLSSSQLNRKLRRLSDKTVTEFMREVRLDAAMELLNSGELSAAEIAYRVGYSSPSYFNNCFHDHFGITPGEVRKQKDSITEPKQGKQNIYVKKVPSHNSDKPVLRIVSVLIIIVLLTAIYFATNRWITKSKQHSAEVKYSIALIPFENINKENEDYLADAIYYELEVHLRDIHNLDVYAGLVVERLVSENASPEEIGNKLDVSHILEGRILKEGNRFKILVVLTEVETGQQIWKDNFDEEFGSIMDVASDIALTVANSIEIILNEEEVSQF